MSEARKYRQREWKRASNGKPGHRQELTPALIRRLERQVRRRKLSPEERKVLMSARPVALLIDQLQGMSYEELLRELQRLEYERRVAGIHPYDWYRIQAVRALIQQHELAASGRIGDMEDDEQS